MEVYVGIEEKVTNLIKEKIEKQGIILDQVLYVKEGNQYFLRVVIDKQGFIDLDDCVNISNIINPILDKNDIIESNYILDVCSKEKGCE
jgi:ribosome maturation factor RimP